MVRLQQLNVYPLKSAQGIELARARVLASGFEWDRHWMAVDANGKFLSQRTHPRLARIAGFMQRERVGLGSGFPREVTSGVVDGLLLPLIHFLLLGFLPIAAMRRVQSPAFGAGCGQIIAVCREAYLRAGGHGAVPPLELIIRRKLYRRAGAPPVEAVRDLALSFPPGSATALLGPSGCGKTTALRILMGLDSDFEGEVRNRPRRLGVVFQEPRLLPWRSLGENLRIRMGCLALHAPPSR